MSGQLDVIHKFAGIAFNLLLFGPKTQAWIIKQLYINFTQQTLDHLSVSCFPRQVALQGKADWKHSRINSFLPFLPSICLSPHLGDLLFHSPLFPHSRLNPPPGLLILCLWILHLGSWSSACPSSSRCHSHSKSYSSLSFQYFRSLPPLTLCAQAKTLHCLSIEKRFILSGWCSNSHFPSTHQVPLKKGDPLHLSSYSSLSFSKHGYKFLIMTGLETGFINAFHDTPAILTPLCSTGRYWPQYSGSSHLIHV